MSNATGKQGMAWANRSREIPRIPLQKYYKDLSRLSRSRRLELANDTATYHSSLVSAFVDSVDLFKDYTNPEPFYSNKNRIPKRPASMDSVTRTHHVAWHFKNDPAFLVTNAPRLNATFVDYEIAPARSTGGIAFAGGGSWRSGVIVDLILVNDDGTPVIAELKIANDKDPFTALVQVLAAAAQLVSTSQYLRLQENMPAANFRKTTIPRVDAYVLLHRFLSGNQKALQALEERASELASTLMGTVAVSTHLRRIACIDIQLLANSSLCGSCRWKFGE